MTLRFAVRIMLAALLLPLLAYAPGWSSKAFAGRGATGADRYGCTVTVGSPTVNDGGSQRDTLAFRTVVDNREGTAPCQVGFNVYFEGDYSGVSSSSVVGIGESRTFTGPGRGVYELLPGTYHYRVEVEFYDDEAVGPLSTGDQEVTAEAPDGFVEISPNCFVQPTPPVSDPGNNGDGRVIQARVEGYYADTGAGDCQFTLRLAQAADPIRNRSVAFDNPFPPADAAVFLTQGVNCSSANNDRQFRSIVLVGGVEQARGAPRNLPNNCA